jgi:hypothetical protein
MFSERWLSSETGSCAVPAFKSRSDASVDTAGNVICTSRAFSSSSLLSQTVSTDSWRLGFFFFCVAPISESVPRKLSAVRGQGSNFFPALLVISQIAVSLLRLLFDRELLLSPACSPRLVCVEVTGGQCCWVTIVSEYVGISLYAWFPYFYDKGLHPLLWVGLRAARAKITVGRIPNCLNYCVMSVVYTHFTNMPAVHILQPGDT